MMLISLACKTLPAPTADTAPWTPPLALLNAKNALQVTELIVPARARCALRARQRTPRLENATLAGRTASVAISILTTIPTQLIQQRLNQPKQSSVSAVCAKSASVSTKPVETTLIALPTPPQPPIASTGAIPVSGLASTSARLALLTSLSLQISATLFANPIVQQIVLQTCATPIPTLKASSASSAMLDT